MTPNNNLLRVNCPHCGKGVGVLLWLSTCFGVVFMIPMAILCVFEFMLWAKADRVSARALAAEAKTLAIFEIVVGLANTGALICGIIVLINSGNLLRQYDD